MMDTAKAEKPVTLLDAIDVLETRKDAKKEIKMAQKVGVGELKSESLLSAITDLEAVTDRIYDTLNLSQDETVAESIADPILAAKDRITHQKRRLVAVADFIEERKEKLHISFGEALL